MDSDVQLDAFGHCATCHLALNDIERVDALISRGKAVSLCLYPCGHSTIYRSAGIWTEGLDMRAPQLMAASTALSRRHELFLASMRA